MMGEHLIGVTTARLHEGVVHRPHRGVELASDVVGGSTPLPHVAVQSALVVDCSLTYSDVLAPPSVLRHSDPAIA